MPVRKWTDGWMIDFWYVTADGTRKRFRKVAAVTSKRDAEAQERAWREEVAPSAASARSATPALEAAPQNQAAFSGFAAHWMDTAVWPDAKRSTAKSYERMLRMHLVPFFGDQDLRAIGAESVQRLKAHAAKEGELGPKSIRNLLQCLSSLFSTAVKWGYCESNPVKLVKAPKLPILDTAFWTSEESQRFLAVAKRDEPRFWLWYFLALRTGLREAELIGLEWQDVDLARRQLHVRRAITEGHSTTPKNHTARIVPLPADVAEALAAAPRRKGTARVFWREKTGGPLTPSMLNKPLDRAALTAGVPRLRIHDLRHSYASQLAIAGVPLSAIQQYLGHKDIKQTQRYAHLCPNKIASWVEVLVPDLGNGMGNGEGETKG